MLKTFPKILIIIFLLIFIFQLASLIFLLLAPSPIQAQITFTPQVTGLNYTFDSSAKSTKNIATYVQAIYKYAIGIVGILAAVVLMLGGILWLTAGGNQTRVGEAKAWIGASLTGLLLALCSYLILATVNPALVNFKITNVEQVTSNASSGGTTNNCCELDLGGCYNTTDTSCGGGVVKTGSTCSNGTCIQTSFVTGCCLGQVGLYYDLCADNVKEGQCKFGVFATTKKVDAYSYSVGTKCIKNPGLTTYYCGK